MGRFRFDRLLDALTSMDVLVAVLWLGLAALTIALLVLMRTRWGQSRPLRKCVMLSFLAHVLLAGYATTVSIVGASPLEAREAAVRVAISEGDLDPEADAANRTPSDKPWESFVHPSSVQPEPAELARAEPAQLREPDRQARTERTGLSNDPALERLPLAEVVQPEPEDLPTDAHAEPSASAGKSPEPIDAPAAVRRQGATAEMPDRPKLDRREYTEVAPIEPKRGVRTGLPSPLLERPLPFPRLSHVPPSPEPNPSLAGPSDVLTRRSPGSPAEWSNPDAPQTAAPTDRTSAPGTGPSPGLGDPLKPPSLARRGDAGPRPPGNIAALEGGRLTVGPPLLPRNRRAGAENQVPAVYSLRVAPDRSRVAQRRGATPQTEAAVQAALAWLADNQAADGRWDARAHSAGRELRVNGRDRQGAGAQADTGLTGLALLAFLASGNTHQDGLYDSNLRAGLEYLLRVQGRDGNLGHAMAACALSEAYGLTGDPQLRDPVYRAVLYTVAAQDPSGGGWRYSPRDPGDTSQLGWQLMVLKSAELAGIPIPERSAQGALRYLQSASSGQYGGLAAYRPVERASRPMTAEALACRMLLGMKGNHPAAEEAGDYLLGELPGAGRKNLYYWYYGTLAMYYLQGERWTRWNRALQKTLLEDQRTSGTLAGSWDPDSVWGGYGGRVYSTALATLCLEVYYRFLPLYWEAPAPGPPSG
jgi:hypothetical protein